MICELHSPYGRSDKISLRRLHNLVEISLEEFKKVIFLETMKTFRKACPNNVDIEECFGIEVILGVADCLEQIDSNFAMGIEGQEML